MPLISFQIDPHADPHGRRLHELLEANRRYQSIQFVRVVLVHALAASGVLLWIFARWPKADVARLRPLTLSFWGCGFVAALFVGFHEWQCYRRLVLLAAREQQSRAG